MDALAMNDFSKKTLAALAHKGITLLGLTVIPDMSKPLPFACGQRGYSVSDNGCGRIWTFSEVMEAAQ